MSDMENLTVPIGLTPKIKKGETPDLKGIVVQELQYAFIRRIQKEKKQAHVKHQLISKQEYVPYVTNPYDTTPYQVTGFDVNVMVPDEAVYKPKKKENKDKISGLENFMELDD